MTTQFRKLLDYLRQPPHDYTPSTQQFLDLNVDKIKRELRLVDEGALRGNAESIVEQIAAYASVGVSHITLDVRPIAAEDVDGQLEAIRRFADGVLPHVR